jgi:glycosyltransferase involved in cell wall biosynthesis
LFDASFISRFVGRITGTPVLESLVNISHESIRVVDNSAVKPWKLNLYRQVDRATMSSVTAFHALTEEVARSWEDTVGLRRDRIVVIPRGVEVDKYGPGILEPDERRTLRQNLTGNPEGLLILAVGREESQKGHRYLIEAMETINGAVTGANLVMAGRTGSATDSLTEQITSLGLGDRVHRVGVRADIDRLMSAADIMVFPSLFEGLGVSLIEGMASSLPIVVFDRPPMNQILEHRRTGLIVADRDVLGIAQAVITLAQDPELANRLGHQAAREARTTYDIRHTSRRMEQLYRDLLDRAPRRARATSRA